MRDAAYGQELSISRAKNQFGKGDINPNAMSIWLVVIPMVCQMAWFKESTKYADDEAMAKARQRSALKLVPKLGLLETHLANW